MKDIEEYVKENEELMLEVLSNLVSYQSVESHEPGFPFGKANAQCLDYALSVCEAFNMKTKNLDYYVGYGEIGEGDKVLGIIGHLDVVPVGGGWQSDPFTLTVRDGKAYGRGTSDDKGPLVSALFAVKYLIDNKVELNKRLRVVFGCNEESGFRCVNHYVKKEGHFDIGFTPDGPFPCCFGEKGIIHLRFWAPNNCFISVNGGLATNVVADSFEAVVAADRVDQEKIIEYLAGEKFEDYALVEENGTLKLLVKGQAAHASTPEEGKNAITYGLCALVAGGLDDEAIQEFYKKIGNRLHGEDCGVDLKDQYGELTMSVGKIAVEEDQICFDVDIRCPFTFENKTVIDKMRRGFRKWKVEVHTDSAGLYQPEDSPFVRILTDTYNEVTGKNLKPVSMGGGTYARGINNTLAFGVDEEDDEPTHVHDANEFVKVDKLLRNCEIYIKSLLKLLEL